MSLTREAIPNTAKAKQAAVAMNRHVASGSETTGEPGFAIRWKHEDKSDWPRKR